MTDFAITFGLWWAPIILLVLILRLFGWVRFHQGWFLFAVLLHFAYAALNSIGVPFFDLKTLVGEMQWNWEGKAATILLTVMVLMALRVLTRDVKFRLAGFTLKQKTGSITPAITLTLFLVGMVVGLEILVQDGADTSPERLFFQSTMPGIDEEMYFRGLLLLVLSSAVHSGSVSLLRAPISWAGILVTVLFGTGHSLFSENGGVSFSGVAFVYTAILGFGLLWIRERTGSVVFPIIAHNLINFSSSFF